MDCLKCPTLTNERRVFQCHWSPCPGRWIEDCCCLETDALGGTNEKKHLGIFLWVWDCPWFAHPPELYWPWRHPELLTPGAVSVIPGIVKCCIFQPAFWCCPLQTLIKKFCFKFIVFSISLAFWKSFSGVFKRGLVLCFL